MNVKDNRKQDRRPYLVEIEPGTLFKHGDSYYIKTNRSVYQERTNIVGMKCCIDTPPEYEFDDWYEPVNAISVHNGMPHSFPLNEVVEVFPKAIICLDEEKTNA